VFDVRVEVPATLVGSIQSVSIPASGNPVVRFSVRDSIGRGAVGLTAATSGGTLRFNLARLTAVTGTGVSPRATEWVAYLTRASAYDGGVDLQPTSERSGGTLVDFGDGTYEYTMSLNVTTATNARTGAVIGYEPGQKHRLGIQVSGRPTGGVASLPPLNLWFDFVPDGSTVTTSREIADEKSCNGCHGKLAVHGGSRSDVQYCVTCHTAGATLRGVSIEMKTMTHKIHMGANLPSVRAGGSYVLGNADFSHVVLPQSVTNCRTCHNGDMGAPNRTPDGNNWREVPTNGACTSCHEDVNANTGTNHLAGARTDATCATCHDSAPSNSFSIERYHASTYQSPNNPIGLRDPSGNLLLSVFRYEISSVTASGNNPVVTFRILRDGTPMDLTGTGLPAGISGGPSFLIAYALPQDGITAPLDYNQGGRPSAQPQSVSLAAVRNMTAGSMAGPDSNGFYTATITGGTWPTGATLRAIGLQGSFTQTVGTTNYGRPTPSAIREVTGDTKRRVVVDNARCLSCHESLQLHGGSRVDNTAICVVCHNPNLSSSGRAADPVQFMTQVNSTAMPLPAASVASRATYLMFAPGASGPPYPAMDPLTWPEESNNFKDMIHGIHASHIRSTPFVFVRDRQASGIFGYDWSHVTYPQVQGNCRACHTNTGYGVNLPAGVLASTQRTTSGDPAETRAQVQTARTNVPNATDLVSSPAAASCVGCHDGALAKAHMQQNGAVVDQQRTALAGTIETCAICHGPGKTADVEAKHPIIR
jgi:OmcA/MtrC family decaheme c-type cytochrome